MFRLRDLKNGLYQIHALRQTSYEGTIKPIVEQSLIYGLRESDLTIALTRLDKEDLDYADFGRKGNLLAVKKGRK